MGKHLIMNDYANAWYVSPQDSGYQPDYRLVIEYTPQRWFYVGLLISLLTLITTIIVGLKKLITQCRERN